MCIFRAVGGPVFERIVNSRIVERLTRDRRAVDESVLKGETDF